MTERIVYMNVGSSTGTDQTASSGGSGSWHSFSSLNSSATRLRRFSSPTANAFLTPAFNACAANPKSTGSPNVDPSLLRYTRSRLPFSASSSSSASNSPDPHSTARKRLHRLLYLRSSLSSLSSSTPLSPIENLPAATARSPTLYKTPVKVEMEEDVLVMDGVLVSDSESGRPRSSVSEFGTGSPSSSSSANNGGGSSLYKTEICRSWEELGFCRYGSKCQYAHGKEELRGTRSMRQRSEVGGQSGRSVPIAGSYVYRNRFRYPPSASLSSASAVGWTTGAIAAPVAKATIMTAEVGFTAVAASTVSPRRSSSEPSFVWPPTPEEEAYINQVLYGSSQRRRLPVFRDVCPE